MDGSELFETAYGSFWSAAVGLLAVASLATGCERLLTAEHAGTIAEDTEWSGLHRVTDDLVVEGARLRVRCGTMVRVEPGATVRVREGGRIVSGGRQGCPITWTSTAEGEEGRWNGVAVQKGGRLVAQWTTFRYAGRYGASMFVARGGRAALTDTRIQEAAHGGLSVEEGGQLERADRLAFSGVRGVPVWVPASALGAVEAPNFESESAGIIVHGGLVDASARWAFPGHTVEVIDDIRVRAPVTIAAETRVTFGIGARMVVEHGGSVRARGNEQLGYRSAHRYVRLGFQPGSGIEIRESAGEGSRFEWVVFEGPAAHPTVPIRVAGDRPVEMVHTFQASEGARRERSGDTRSPGPS